MNDFPNLPKSWQVKTLGECLDYEQPTKYIVKSTKYDDSYKTPVLTAGKSFILGYTNESDGIFTQTPVIIFDDFTTDTKFVDFDFKVKSSAMKILHPKENIDIKFVYYLMQTIQYRSDTHKRYWISQYAKIKIPIPPLEIQRRIVKRLDKAFSRIESGTKHLKSVKDNLAKYKQSLLKSAFNGTLTNDCPLSLGESMPPLQSESINTHPLAPSAREGEQEDCHESLRDSRNDDKDSLNGESANLPQGWTIKTLGEVFKVVGGGTPSTTKTEFWNGNIAWITSADIDLQDFTIAPKRFITDEAIRLSTTNLVEKDTIIVVTRVGLGKVGITDRQTCFSQDSQALIPLENINVKFMAFQIKYQAKNFIAVSRGTTISGITKSTLKEVKLVIPPLEIQKQIVAILERHFTGADKVSAYIDSCLSKAKQLKSSLLKSAFDGTLTNESTHP